MHRILLPIALVSSIATSIEEPTDDRLSGRAFIANTGSAEVVVEVRVQHQVDCLILDSAPWLGSAVRFPEDPTAVLTLEGGMTLPILEEAYASGEDVETVCFTAEIRHGEVRRVVHVLSGQVVERVDFDGLPSGVVTIDASSEEVFTGGDMLDPRDLRTCASPETRWTTHASGRFELLRRERSEECWLLDFGEKVLEICGLDVPGRVGDVLDVQATETFLQIQAVDGFAFAGAVNPYLPLQLEVTHDLIPDCALQTACGGMAQGLPFLEGTEVPLGETVDVGGRLLVSSAWVPLNTDCDPVMVVGYSEQP